jgi:TRAP-type mannitol/chloroaromatic compound transport system permease small subunit
MSTARDSGPMPRLPAPVRVYVRWVDAVSGAIGLASMYLVFLMMGVLLLDAVTRNVVHMPQHWPIEFAQFTLAAYYFGGGAYSLREGAHVRMDLLYMRLGLRGRALMDMITSACMLFYLAVLLWGAISSLEYSIEIDQHLFSMWNPSVIPIKVFMAASIVLMILQGISLIFKDYAIWRGADIR